MIGRKLFYSLPPAMRFLARKIVFFPQDVLTGKAEFNGITLPPKSMIYTGGGPFLETGQKFVDLFVEHGGLLPHSSVLDIGSGLGRMAIPMTAVLNKQGSYQGFDAIEAGVHWCNENIHVLYPNFNFKYVPLKNKLYRNDGLDPSEFTFPYTDASVDLAYAVSVFTHLLPETTEQYFKEIARVLRPGGKAVLSFFVYDQDTQFPSNFDFPFAYDSYKLMDKKVPTANIAYAFPYIESLAEESGLKLSSSFHGGWNGSADPKDFQDILIFEK